MLFFFFCGSPGVGNDEAMSWDDSRKDFDTAGSLGQQGIVWLLSCLFLFIPASSTNHLPQHQFPANLNTAWSFGRSCFERCMLHSVHLI